MKFRVFLPLLGILMVFGGPAAFGGILGYPDDVPARRVIVPFFNLEVNGAEDFLVTAVNTFSQDINVHVIVYDRNTEYAYNFYMKFTPGDVEGFSMRTLIGNMPGVSRQKILMEEGGREYYRGEITLDVMVIASEGDPPTLLEQIYGNVLLGYVYWIDVPTGSLATFNALHVQQGVVSELFSETDKGNRLTDEDGYEVFTADALRDLQDAVVLGAVPQTGFNGLDFFARYFIPSTEGSEASLILWTDRRDETFGLTLLVYDEAENIVSTFVSAPHQVNIYDLREGIPAAFVNPDGHRAGWIHVRSDGRGAVMWMRERMVGFDGLVMDGIRRVHRDLAR